MGKIEAFGHAFTAGLAVFKDVWQFLESYEAAPGVKMDDLTITHTISFTDEGT